MHASIPSTRRFSQDAHALSCARGDHFYLHAVPATCHCQSAEIFHKGCSLESALTRHCVLKAVNRWSLSGTPIQNRVEELYPYFKFLEYEPFCDRERFNQVLLRPCLSLDDHFWGHESVRNTLKTIMIRRLKTTRLSSGEPIVNLPSR